MKDDDIIEYTYFRCEFEPTAHIDVKTGDIKVTRNPTWIRIPISRIEWETHLRVLHRLAVYISETTRDVEGFYARAVLN